MDLSLVRLSAPVSGPPSTGVSVGPDTVADILWATATPADRLEHVRARPGPRSGTVDVALFHRSVAEPCESDALGLGLCRRAVACAPALAGWTAEALPGPSPF